MSISALGNNSAIGEHLNPNRNVPCKVSKLTGSRKTSVPVFRYQRRDSYRACVLLGQGGIPWPWELALATIISESLSTLSCLLRIKLLEPDLVSFMLPWFG